jgi:hypothetical protein
MELIFKPAYDVRPWLEGRPEGEPELRPGTISAPGETQLPGNIPWTEGRWIGERWVAQPVDYARPHMVGAWIGWEYPVGHEKVDDTPAGRKAAALAEADREHKARLANLDHVPQRASAQLALDAKNRDIEFVYQGELRDETFRQAEAEYQTKLGTLTDNDQRAGALVEFEAKKRQAADAYQVEVAKLNPNPALNLNTGPDVHALGELTQGQIGAGMPPADPQPDVPAPVEYAPDEPVAAEPQPQQPQWPGRRGRGPKPAVEPGT